MKPIVIDAVTIPDAWFQCLWNLIHEAETPNGAARTYTVETGSNAGDARIEFDLVTVVITHPGARPLLPTIPEQMDIPPPADDDYLEDYVQYLLSGAPPQPGEAYTYGERFAAQWQYVIDYYRAHGRLTNRMCMEVARPEDLRAYDNIEGSSPCLRLVDTRVMDGKLHWIVYFRSWNLWSGLPVNLAGLQIAKEIMAAEIGVEDGEMVAISKGLNLRGYNLDVAMARLQRSSKPFMPARNETLSLFHHSLIKE